MREGGYNLNEQVSDVGGYHTVDEDEDRVVTNEPPTHPAPGTGSYKHILDPDSRPARVMPHTHVPWIADQLADHVVTSHGVSRASVQMMYARGGIVEFHVGDHPDGVLFS